MLRPTLIALLALPLVAQSADDPTFTKSIRPFLDTHCVACHGPEKQKSRIRFDQLTGYDHANALLWTNVHEVLNAGEMPPEDETQPTPSDSANVLTWIEDHQRDITTGRIRRLNRRELSAALQDLTGRTVDFAGGLPEDGKVAGFDTGAAALHDAADSVEQIMAVSRRAVDAIRFLEPAPATPVHLDFLEPQYKDIRKAFDRLKEHHIISRGKSTVWDPEKGLYLTPKWLGDRDPFSLHVPVPADGGAIVRLTLTVSAHKAFENLPNPHLAISIGGKPLAHLEITNPYNEPQTLTFEAQAEDLAIENDGIAIDIRNLVEMPYAVDGFDNEDKTKPEDKIPGGGGLYRPVYDRKKTPVAETPAPLVLLLSMAVEHDAVTPWPPADWNTTTEITDSTPSAKTLLTLWLDRAYRRPSTPGEQTHFLTFYTKLRADGLTFDNALRATFQSALLSAPFRYLASPADPDPTIAQHAIASRLSFMLTGAPPDAELRALAAASKLRDPKIIDAQIDRLLDSPDSENFFRPFVTQWLEMNQPITLVMDYFNQQDFRFGRYLKQSMRDETVAYVTHLITENRPARELVHSDWTMMNNSLARHYNYDDITGGQLRPVTLRENDPRGGGILGHAGLQSMLTWMGDNWVIYRGAWTLRHILDDPPPPPPLDVPELDPTAGENKNKTTRELLLQHQEDENCTVCHRTMDPLGFAFQNFDPAGRWRAVQHEKYIRNELDGKIEWRGEGKTSPLDTTGTLPRGEPFTTYAEAKQLIAQHYLDDVLEGLLKNLTLYATGRQPDVGDLHQIRTIIKSHANKNHPLRDTLKSFLKSDIVLNR